jgi:exoribonuclease-2
VRMVTHAAPHQGLGVDQYAWSTSPLRRYTDLVNQWQIIACVQHGVTAALVAPFKPKDADLFAIVSGFDAAYAAYGDFQTNMERYWCLRWLGQEKCHQVDAVVLKDEVLRLLEIPLIIRLPGMPQVARGAQVRLEVIRWDELDLTIEVRLLEMLSTLTEEDLEEAPEDEPEMIADADVIADSSIAPEDATEGTDGLPLQESNSVAEVAEELVQNSDGVA